MQPDRSRANLVAVLVAVAGLVMAGCAGTQPAQPPASASAPPASEPGALDGETSSAQPSAGESEASGDTSSYVWSEAPSTLYAGPGLQLKLMKFEKRYLNRDFPNIEQCTDYSAIPALVGQDSAEKFCYRSLGKSLQLDTGFSFIHHILIKNASGEWVLSGYDVAGSTLVPNVGEHRIDCEIRQSGKSAAAASSPFTCSARFEGTGPDSQPIWEVTGKQVRTIDASDPAQADEAMRLLNEYCKDAPSPLCTYEATEQQVRAADRDAWLLYGQPYGNCVNEDGARYELEVKKTLEWTDSIKTSVKAEFDIEVVKGGVDVEYQHKITASYEVSQLYEIEVPFGKVGAFYIQPGYLEITGDFQLYGNDATYLIKNATIQLPLGQEYKPQGRDLAIEPAIIHGVVLGDDPSCVTGATNDFTSLEPGSAPPADAVDLGPAQAVN